MHMPCRVQKCPRTLTAVAESDDGLLLLWWWCDENEATSEETGQAKGHALRLTDAVRWVGGVGWVEWGRKARGMGVRRAWFVLA